MNRNLPAYKKAKLIARQKLILKQKQAYLQKTNSIINTSLPIRKVSTKKPTPLQSRTNYIRRGGIYLRTTGSPPKRSGCSSCGKKIR